MEASVHELERIRVNYRLCRNDINPRRALTEPMKPRYHLPEEEIALGPACWIWDYLRRSKAAGFLIPLSGGIDSCATSVIVYSMCRLVVSEMAQGNEVVIADATRLCGGLDPTKMTADEFCGELSLAGTLSFPFHRH